VWVWLWERRPADKTQDKLPDYVPLLPLVKAKAPVIDANKGYFVAELKPGAFMVTEGAYESIFVNTGKDVVLSTPRLRSPASRRGGEGKNERADCVFARPLSKRPRGYAINVGIVVWRKFSTDMGTRPVRFVTVGAIIA
jgi:hypothetical protein